MRILFVAMTATNHVARWIAQLSGLGWDIHVFGDNGDIHPNLKNVTVYKPMPRAGQDTAPEGTTVRYWYPFRRGEELFRRRLGPVGRAIFPDTSHRLARIIKELQPDIIHTIKMQPYGYQVQEAREILGGKLPAPWLYTSWGRDTFVYRHQPDHLPRIKKVFETLDYYIADAGRDIPVATELGFKGEIIGVFPGAGGFDLEAMAKFRAPGPASARRKIAVKGYQTDDGGQVLTALEGIRQVADLLADYTVIIHGGIGTYASNKYDQVQRVVDELISDLGIKIEIWPFVPYEQILELFGSARIGMSISRSDGTPVTMLEWIAMGAFPIESNTGAPAEWIQPGINGDIVPFDDPDQIAQALRRSLQDDALVDRANDFNAKLAKERLDQDVIRSRVIEVYERIATTHSRS